MKAAVYTSYGPPAVVQIQDVEKPEPSDNEVLIQVRAIAVNPLDMVIKGRRYLARLVTELRTPKVTRVGVDVAGQVEAVGRHVTQFKPGDEVFGACLRDPHTVGVNVWVCQGAFAEPELQAQPCRVISRTTFLRRDRRMLLPEAISPDFPYESHHREVRDAKLHYIEQGIPGSIVRLLTDVEMNHYREPLRDPASRKSSAYYLR
jgi:hypothetical protein